MVFLDLHDVVKLGDRPEGAKEAFLAVVDRVLFTQPFKVTPMVIIHEQIGVADIDVFQGNGIGIVC